MKTDHADVPVHTTGQTALPPGTKVTTGVPLPPSSPIRFAVVQQQGAELIAVKGCQTRADAHRALASLGEAMPDLLVVRLRREVQS